MDGVVERNKAGEEDAQVEVDAARCRTGTTKEYSSVLPGKTAANMERVAADWYYLASAARGMRGFATRVASADWTTTNDYLDHHRSVLLYRARSWVEAADSVPKESASDCIPDDGLDAGVGAEVAHGGATEVDGERTPLRLCPTSGFIGFLCSVGQTER